MSMDLAVWVIKMTISSWAMIRCMAMNNIRCEITMQSQEKRWMTKGITVMLEIKISIATGMTEMASMKEVQGLRNRG